MRAWLRKLRHRLRERQQRAQFDALPQARCDVSALRAPVQLFTQDRTEEWREQAARLEPLGSSDRTAAVNPGDRRAIYHLVRELGCRSVLEVGTHVGGSTAAIVLALLKNGANRLTSVDILDVNAPDAPWKRLGVKYPPREAVRQLGADFVRFVTSPSLDYLRSTEERFDLVFLDGGHEAATVYQEVPAALRVLNPGGVILLHDYYPGGRPLWSDGGVVRGPWDAMDRLEREGARLRARSLGPLPWPTKLGSNATSLALVTQP